MAKMDEQKKQWKKRLMVETKGELADRLMFAYVTIQNLEAKLEDAKNTEQQVQPDNGQICTRPGYCAKGQKGKCYSGVDCPDKAIAG
jgi:hypothetical protein